jgi:hypothetical protein
MTQPTQQQPAPQQGQQQQLPAQLPAQPQQVGQPQQGTPANQQQQPAQGGLLQQGQQGQQATNQWTGLLDVAPQQGQQPQQQAQPGQYGQLPQQFSQQGQPYVDQNAIADLVGRHVQSAIDRLVNQQRNPQWQQAHGQPSQQQGQPSQQPQPQYAPPAPVPTGPSDGDLREARMAAREYLTGSITFGNVDEQGVAADLAASLIPGMLGRGYTPDQAGREVATQIAGRITQLRRSYEEAFVRALRARGGLREDGQQTAGFTPSQGIPVGGLPVSQTDATRLQAKAKQMGAWAAEQNTQQGWTTEPAATK